MDDWKEPRPMTRVKYRGPEETLYPFSMKYPLLYLGEITNMSGHCAIVDHTGKVFYGFHIENFREMTDDDDDFTGYEK